MPVKSCNQSCKEYGSEDNNFDSDFSNANSNGNLNLNDAYTNDGTEMNPCLRSFKACCKKKADFGLEDLFWILFLIVIITFSIVKGITRIGWSQIFYMLLTSILVLIVLYVLATAFNKFILEDSSTAHWNAHARFTQAAIQSRIRDEEQRVHVIAPPKMGGAKLNIIYTVGDVPLASKDSTKSSRHPSSGSLFSNLTQQAVNTATAALIAPTNALPTSLPCSPPLHYNSNRPHSDLKSDKSTLPLSGAENSCEMAPNSPKGNHLPFYQASAATSPKSNQLMPHHETIEEERVDSPLCVSPDAKTSESDKDVDHQSVETCSLTTHSTTRSEQTPNSERHPVESVDSS